MKSLAVFALAVALHACSVTGDDHQDEAGGCLRMGERQDDNCYCQDGESCSLDCSPLALLCSLYCANHNVDCSVTCADNCSALCQDAVRCSATCGDDCLVACQFVGDTCEARVGERGDVRCEGANKCLVKCSGSCSVDCLSSGRCRVACNDPDKCSLLCSKTGPQPALCPDGKTKVCRLPCQ